MRVHGHAHADVECGTALFLHHDADRAGTSAGEHYHAECAGEPESNLHFRVGFDGQRRGQIELANREVRGSAGRIAERHGGADLQRPDIGGVKDLVRRENGWLGLRKARAAERVSQRLEQRFVVLHRAADHPVHPGTCFEGDPCFQGAGVEHGGREVQSGFATAGQDDERVLPVEDGVIAQQRRQIRGMVVPKHAEGIRPEHDEETGRRAAVDRKGHAIASGSAVPGPEADRVDGIEVESQARLHEERLARRAQLRTQRRDGSWRSQLQRARDLLGTDLEAAGAVPERPQLPAAKERAQIKGAGHSSHGCPFRRPWSTQRSHSNEAGRQFEQ